MNEKLKELIQDIINLDMRIDELEKELKEGFDYINNIDFNEIRSICNDLNQHGINPLNGIAHEVSIAKMKSNQTQRLTR